MSEFHREVISGEGPWQVVFYGGVAMRVEVSQPGQRTIVVGHRPFEAECARCGTMIRSSTPSNEDADCCEQCEDAAAAAMGMGE